MQHLERLRNTDEANDDAILSHIEGNPQRLTNQGPLLQDDATLKLMMQHFKLNAQ